MCGDEAYKLKDTCGELDETCELDDIDLYVWRTG